MDTISHRCWYHFGFHFGAIFSDFSEPTDLVKIELPLQRELNSWGSRGTNFDVLLLTFLSSVLGSLLELFFTDLGIILASIWYPLGVVLGIKIEAWISMLFWMIPGGSWGVPKFTVNRGWVLIWGVAGVPLSYLEHRFLYLRTQIACYPIPDTCWLITSDWW